MPYSDIGDSRNVVSFYQSPAKWFGAIYRVASDQGGIAALRLFRQINVSWITASPMLRKIRIAMGHRNSICRLHELIEIDDALTGGRHTGGKRGQGAARKAPILVAVENRGKCAGFRDQSKNGIAICQTTSCA